MPNPLFPQPVTDPSSASLHEFQLQFSELYKVWAPQQDLPAFWESQAEQVLHTNINGYFAPVLKVSSGRRVIRRAERGKEGQGGADQDHVGRVGLGWWVG